MSNSNHQKSNGSYITVADELDIWLTQHFAAIIITRFFRKIKQSSQSFLYYLKHQTKQSAKKKYLTHLHTIPSFHQQHLHSFLPNQQLSNKVFSSSSKTNPTDYYQSILYQHHPPPPSTFLGSTTSLLSSNSSFQQSLNDKFQFWRNILELKRFHPSYPNEVLMKCLIECEGDLTKAMILIENPQFILTQQQLLQNINSNSNNSLFQLNSAMKGLFLPFYEHYQYYQERSQNLMNSINSDHLSPGNLKNQALDYGNVNTNTNISTIRSLRLRHSLENPSEVSFEDEMNTRGKLCKKKKELLLNLIAIVEKSYLPLSSAAPSTSTKTQLKKVKLKLAK